MYFHIREIVLWPKDERFAPRRLRFETGMVNVISGASKTGKSAIVPIIDYCLGAEKCAIPVGPIRKACAWFGIVVETIAGQKLIARREPGDQKSTSDLFLLEGQHVEVPDRIETKNATVDALKASLDSLAGLSAFGFDPEGQTGFRSRASFRDLAAFTFQSQNIIANPDVLFFKAETFEHQQRLRVLFPYVLGAIDPESLARQQDLERLRKLLQRKESELATARSVSERWLAQMAASAREARELGLITNELADSLSRDELVALLRQVVTSAPRDARATTQTLNESVRDAVRLQEDEARLSSILSVIRRRAMEIAKLRSTRSDYEGALRVQGERLAVSDWLAQIHSETAKCPICATPMDETSEQLRRLTSELQKVEATTARVHAAGPAAFDREAQRLESETGDLTEKLTAIRIRRDSLERQSDQVRQDRFRSNRVARFVGGLEQALQTFEALGENTELAEEVAELRARVADLQDSLRGVRSQDRLQRALAAITTRAGQILPTLDAERPDDPIKLSIEDLTVKVTGDSRDDYLWEIGSGANWLSYHVAVSLALQEFFVGMGNSPVPSFIVFDQPSQVYFPRVLAANAATKMEDDPEFRDEDVESVRKIFSAFATAVHKTNGKLQIIALDHAAENVWGDIDGVRLVDEWRDGQKLVPKEWIENLSSNERESNE